MSESNATFEMFKDSGGQWRWRLVHTNGNIVADSGEGYATKQKAKQGIESVKDNAPGADVVESE
ncbi:MAG: HVO_2922 family protein [Halolamina sp.]